MPVTAFPHHEAANRAQILRSRSQALTKSRKCGSVLCHTDVPSICAKRVFLAFAQRAPIELLVPPSDRGYRLRAWFTGSFVTLQASAPKASIGIPVGRGVFCSMAATSSSRHLKMSETKKQFVPQSGLSLAACSSFIVDDLQAAHLKLDTFSWLKLQMLMPLHTDGSLARLRGACPTIVQTPSPSLASFGRIHLTSKLSFSGWHSRHLLHLRRGLGLGLSHVRHRKCR